jgi:hypothetical protein
VTQLAAKYSLETTQAQRDVDALMKGRSNAWYSQDEAVVAPWAATVRLLRTGNPDKWPF